MFCETQYLQWDSHHSLSSKYSVIGTLTHRAKVVCTNSELLQGELNHLRRALGKCNYPTWAIKRVQQKSSKQQLGEYKQQQSYQHKLHKWQQQQHN